MPFIHDDFLLTTEAARRLFHAHAVHPPILDYHCHLPPRDIATNRRFNNLFEAWLEGDHYKWRAMRANGVEEKYCTGNADPYEKFLAWARTVPYTLRNPLYHWTHLELKRYFGIDDLLDGNTAPVIWDRDERNARLGRFDRARNSSKKFGVKALCTTDDPADDLAWHEQIATSDLETQVFPAFRPDMAFAVDRPEEFKAWTEKLSAVSNIEVSDLKSLLYALRQRHDFFHEVGCRLSDHGIAHVFDAECTDSQAAAIVEKALVGDPATARETARFGWYMLLEFGRMDAEKGWTKQIHLGAYRSVNTRGLREVGRDSGFDSIGDWPQAEPLGRYLDRLEQENSLPKMILYNLNPADNFNLATMIGNFQDGKTPGKMQFGSGWWHLDQKEGMEWQMNALSNVGLLSRFVGMLTDSRSFLSYPRHEYFRRVLCNLLGADVQAGLLPEIPALGEMIENICFNNARDYLRLPLE